MKQTNNWISNLENRLQNFSDRKGMKIVRISTSVIWNLGFLFLTLLVAGIIFAGSIGAGYFASLVKDEKLTSKEDMRNAIFTYEETSKLYFADNKYLGKMRTDLERTETTLKDVNPYIIDAVIATEDEDFYNHNGIVPKAVFRGLLQDVSNSATQTGGSTLTQQLIKNQILTNEVSYARKAKEILLAMRLETFMTKDEILEAYLNVIPYGRNSSGTNIAGVETAAEGIFDKKAEKLNLAQSAFIAGIPQSPYAYTPYTQSGELKDGESLQKGVNRMKTVLYRMHETGKITDKEYEKALKYDIAKDFREREPKATEKYPYVTYEVEERAKEVMAYILAKKDGIDTDRLDNESRMLEKYMILADRELRQNGYKIYSTVDKDLYNAMNKVKESFPYYGVTQTKQVTNNETGKTETIQAPVQVGSMLIENKTGRILSFIGGRDHKIEELNHATNALRSNGSTMKPLLVYGPAIEYGKIGAGSPLADVKFKVGSWEPANFTASEERGLVSAREALKDSLNLPALRLYAQIMDKNPITYLQKNGFESIGDSDVGNYSTAIGGLTYGVTIEENTNAYATFANGGKNVDAYMISKIVDSNGKTVYKNKKEAKKVYSKETSYIVTDMLRDVLSDGTGKVAKSTLKFSADFAAKSGTSQNFNDVWFMGYNPDVTLSVWLGYDQPQSLQQGSGIYFEPGKRVNLLWGQLMNAVYDTNKKLATADGKTFSRPANVVSRTVCAATGASSSCSGNKITDLFNAKLSVPAVTIDDLLKPFGGDKAKLSSTSKKDKDKDKKKPNNTSSDRSTSSNSNSSSSSSSTNSSSNESNSNSSSNSNNSSNEGSESSNSSPPAERPSEQPAEEEPANEPSPSPAPEEPTSSNSNSSSDSNNSSSSSSSTPTEQPETEQPETEAAE